MRVYISSLYNNFSLALNKVFDVRYLCSLPANNNFDVLAAEFAEHCAS